MKKTLLIIYIVLTAIISHAQVTDGLVAKYSFNNGNANDEIGLNDGTVHGATLTTDRFGNPNKAYLFIDGDYITLPNAPALKSSIMTVSLWVRIDSSAFNSNPYDLNYIYSIINSSTGSFFSSFCFSINTSDKKYFSINQNNSSESVFYESIKPSAFKWQHYVLSVDDDSFKMYIDGEMQWSHYKGFTTTFTSDSIYIGKSGNISYPGNLNGAVDDIRVYNKVLNLSEVDSLYHEGNPMNTVGINEAPSIGNTINIYPNPTLGKVYWSGHFDAKLIDPTGQKIFEKENSTSFDLSGYPAGVYFILLSDKKRQIQERVKLIKK